MQKLIFLLASLWAFCSHATAQDALEKEITVIVNDLVTKMNAKPGIKNVAISDFTKLDGTATELGKYLAEQFSDVMVNSNAHFSIVDRARLNFLLKEAGLDSKGLLDPSSAAKLGKLKGVDAIVIGSMTAEGENLRVNVKALNLESAVILASAKGNIRRTPAIIDLEGKDLGGETPPVVTKPPAPPGPPGPLTFEKAPFLFECLECKQSGTDITCKFRITSKGEDINVGIYAGSGSKIIDDNGNDFHMSNIRLGNVSGSSWKRKDLVADVPMNAEFTFSKVNRQVIMISKMDVLGGNNLNIVLKNIPVKH